MPHKAKRRICFVTGTRAEFGLMQSTLRALRNHPRIDLQIVVTGMHLSRAHGHTVDAIDQPVNARVPWRSGANDPVQTARSTGDAIAGLAKTFAKLKTEIVLVVGDRVEAFAAASAAHISGLIVAHVHGGDRALGQVDDALRHAITKLAHLHFPATTNSAKRLKKLGEDSWRIHNVGAPGIDGVTEITVAKPVRTAVDKRKYALLILHPASSDDELERRRAELILRTVRSISFSKIIIIHPNNDPGSSGISNCWEKAADAGPRIYCFRNLDRPEFVALLRDAAVLVGNSSAGIIEAASFGTPVIDVGPRQAGRERNNNVINIPYSKLPLAAALGRIWNNGKPIRFARRNLYGGGNTGAKIARVLSSTPLTDRIRRKLIAY